MWVYVKAIRGNKINKMGLKMKKLFILIFLIFSVNLYADEILDESRLLIFEGVNFNGVYSCDGTYNIYNCIMQENYTVSVDDISLFIGIEYELSKNVGFGLKYETRKNLTVDLPVYLFFKHNNLKLDAGINTHIFENRIMNGMYLSVNAEKKVNNVMNVFLGIEYNNYSLNSEIIINNEKCGELKQYIQFMSFLSGIKIELWNKMLPVMVKEI